MKLCLSFRVCISNQLLKITFEKICALLRWSSQICQIKLRWKEFLHFQGILKLCECQQGLISEGEFKCVVESVQMSRRWQQSHTEPSDGCDCRSQLHIMPQTKLLTRCHTTVQIQLWCSMSPLSGTKQTTGIHLRIDMKRMQHFAFRLRLAFQYTKAGTLWIWIIIFFSSESSFTAINTLLCGLMWLIFGLFSTQAFVARFTAQKPLWCHSAFYITTSSVQSWRHALLCFLLLLTEETHYHKKLKKNTHTNYVPLGTGVCPSSVHEWGWAMLLQ